MTTRHTFLYLLRGLSLPILLLIVQISFLNSAVLWGLPSRDADHYLFGSRVPWSADQIASHAQPVDVDPQRASDVDANPLDRSQPIVINQTDAQRAEIVRRYRLFSHQPDEMQTFMAMAAMNPGARQFDPKTYKYGGLWIYPVGAMLKAADMAGVVQLKSDLGYYLDHPEHFAPFYLVARLYVVFWGVIGAAAVGWIAYRFTGSLFAIWIAVFCFTFMPLVMSTVHEAKPHLPGAVLILMTGIMGIRYLDTRHVRWLWLCGIVAGLATGMVPSAWVAFAALPVIALSTGNWRWPIAAGVLGIAAYFMTNPYVAINLLTNRALLTSNLGNTADFYHIGWRAIPDALRLMSAGMSICLLAAGLFGAIGLIVRRRKSADAASPRAQAWVIALPAIIAGVQFMLFAADQPGDYARFALSANIALAIVAVVAIHRAVRPLSLGRALLVLITISTIVPGSVILRGFIRDSQPDTSRMRAAADLEALKQAGARRMAVYAEPAPYCLPPVDLFEWEIVLVPRGHQLPDDIDVVVTVGSDKPDLFGQSIAWSDVAFTIKRLR